MDSLIKSLSKRFFVRTPFKGRISVIVQWNHEVKSILNKHGNLKFIEQFNLINGSIQAEFDII
jgi:hypothetical protein